MTREILDLCMMGLMGFSQNPIFSPPRHMLSAGVPSVTWLIVLDPKP